MEVVTNEKRKDYEVMTKRFGFTLAEVLITLGIIGVVAAMTIPTLISNTNGAKFRSQFKKTISTLNQAGLMSQAQYDFDYAGTTQKCGEAGATEETDESGNKTQKAGDPSVEHPDSAMSFCAILNGTLTGQTYQGAVNSIKRNNNGAEATYALKTKKTLPDNYTAYLAYTLADGSIVAFSPNATSCELTAGSRMNGAWIDAHPACLGFIDVNGATLPNREVTCTTEANTKNTVETPCVVKNDANHMTDVFPIVFHDATVEPASNAAKYVLTTSK